MSKGSCEDLRTRLLVSAGKELLYLRISSAFKFGCKLSHNPHEVVGCHIAIQRFSHTPCPLAFHLDKNEPMGEFLPKSTVHYGLHWEFVEFLEA